MKQLCALLIILLLTGCASTRHAATYQTQQDSTYFSKHRLDSLFAAIFQHDSIYQRDSIFVYQKGDTVTKYVERIKYKLEQRTDTLRINTVRVDTLYAVKVDSVRVEIPVYIEKPMKWYNTGFIWVGRLCCIAAIIWALFLYLKQKF